MKHLSIILIVISIISLHACGDIGSNAPNEVTNKAEYIKLKDAVYMCKADFKEKIIKEAKYSKMMEDFGDVYVESVDAIPPERRYRVAIFCYKEALKHDKSNKELKKKLQKQQSIFQVVNQ